MNDPRAHRERLAEEAKMEENNLLNNYTSGSETAKSTEGGSAWDGDSSEDEDEMSIDERGTDGGMEGDADKDIKDEEEEEME